MPTEGMSRREQALQSFDRLLTIMDELRERCPWDKKQTLQSLRHLTLEETYELADAVVENNLEEVKKELGDLLLHVVFYAKIGSETGDFDIADVVEAICEKLVVRHPHVYGDVRAADAEVVKQNWEAIKLKEGNKSVLGGVPKGLPALVKAMRIQDKVSAVGFDWEMPGQVWEKLQEELTELQQEVLKGDREAMMGELGDVLFSVINYARFLDLNPEEALERTNKKFIDRFQYIETKASEQGRLLKDISLAEMEMLWKQAKGV